jgi:hypothetical protein
MQVLRVLLLIAGVVFGAVGVWRKKNPGGPVFFGHVTDSIRDLYGVKTPGHWPIIVGAILFLAGFVLVLLK